MKDKATPIILIGFMAAGKTTIGRALSQRLNLPFIDTDELVQKQIHMPIASYFAQYGEPAFRLIEAEVLQQALQTPGVIATGGGCVETPANCTLLKSFDQVIYLEADFSRLWQRLGQASSATRPLLSQGYDHLHGRYLQRQTKYLDCASHVVPTDQETIETIIGQIEQVLALRE